MKGHRLFFLLLGCLLAVCADVSFSVAAQAVEMRARHWTVTDGLPTGEVQQIIALPNRQMLVNCEGAFCLSNGSAFVELSYDRSRAYRLPHYTEGYAHLWQGDSLLWLRDFYRLYLYDVRTRKFIYDIEDRLSDVNVNGLLNGQSDIDGVPAEMQPIVDSFKLQREATVAVNDYQGGTWIGTWHDGIFRLPPRRPPVQVLSRDEAFALLRQVQPEPVVPTLQGLLGAPVNFVIPLSDGCRQLVCYDLNQLAYFDVQSQAFSPIRVEGLSAYRRFTGACPLDDQWTVVYAQNGAFLLDVTADTLASFTQAEAIERYSDKYNCMMLDDQNRLWTGTQNGLFFDGQRIMGLANNCIRSLVEDSSGNIWVGTACGISKVIKGQDWPFTVFNYGPDDGIPAVFMAERAAGLLPDGRLCFVHAGGAIAFLPEEMAVDTTPLPTVLTAAPEDSPRTFRENTVTFCFSALNYAHPSHVRYRYRLCGLEAEWQHVTDSDGSQATVVYRSLPPGNYVFEAQAAVDDGPWGEAGRAIVTILPPWWLTWWAKLIYGLLCLLSLMCLLHFYLKRKRVTLERENDERVNRLFELRDAARHQFAEHTAIDASKISANVEEEEFVKRILTAIHEHLDHEDYGVEQLARDVAVSRSALYDKLRNMLGISPADFIRNVRLKYAAELLTSTKLSIAEVSERVGFNTPRIFSSNFKKMFGCLPSEYRTSSLQTH